MYKFRGLSIDFAISDNKIFVSSTGRKIPQVYDAVYTAAFYLWRLKNVLR